MATLQDPDVRELLEQPNYAVISTHNKDGSIHNTIVWVDAEDDSVAVNSALGRKWPGNLERDPRATVLVYEAGNPYHYLEVRGKVTADPAAGDAHIDRLAKKYTGKDQYPYRRPGEQRIKFVITPDHIRHMKR